MTVKMKAKQLLKRGVISVIKHTIAEAGGNEVLFVGRIDDKGIVSEITVAARGDESAVPALFRYMEESDVVLHNHPSGMLTPSNADLQIASQLGNHGIGFYIIDNRVENLYAVAEPIGKKQREELDSSELEGCLLPGGSLSREIDYYETRHSQVEMLKAVVDSFNRDRICVIEAGTGVGKSLAYLLPAIKWAELNNERVVISTATINLQQQLTEKDIPLVTRLIDTKVKTVLVKGRGNYVCLRRLEEALEENSLFRERDDELENLKNWVMTTDTGSKSDLSFYPDSSLWGRVCSETDSCMGLRCSSRDRCFVLKARREACSANVLITNHHLLFSDLAMRISGAGFDNTAVLPPFSRIIFDEAHTIEGCATSFFSDFLNKFALYKQLSRLYRRKRGRAFGVALKLETQSGLEKFIPNIPPAVDRIKEQMEVLDEYARAFMGNDSTVWINGDTSEEVKSKILKPMHELQNRIIDLMEICSEILERLEGKNEENPESYELALVYSRLGKFASICEKFYNYKSFSDWIFWIEKSYTSSGEGYARFIITPLDVSSLMREAVFEPYQSVVCTSATLTVKRSFSFWMSRLGLKGFREKEVDTAIFPSPFPYKDHVLLAIPEDIPPPDEGGYEEHLSGYIGKVLEISEGKALVLFTSYELLKKIYQEVKVRLNELGITVLRQGEDDRARLLNRFNTDTASVLFATDSFWTGIDAPGETLKVVIISRLPFRVPTDPVVRARMEAISRGGGNPFMEMALPEAVLKFKQGFGRLMRRNTDRGVVLVLDSRVVKKSYGALFTASLPETFKIVKGGDEVLQRIENFLYG